MNIETAFVRKILDNMAEFTGKEDTDRREEFLQIIHNFPIADLEDAGLKRYLWILFWKKRRIC